MYQALYRKYRPQIFSDVVGQEVIVKTLKNSISNGKFGHAYMFFGPRGTGKTTLSKIFARSINCLNPIDGESCGKCDNCLRSYQKECVDIIEMDAASNNGVDEIRELRNKISLVPAYLKYKVYIIDEVHMLSIGAFNALLKTLEEPPEHAVFILATTDPQKVPETIISRCQCFSFKRISNNSIIHRLENICGKENIDIDDEVLNEIAISSNGGLRDAIGILDKLTSYTSNKIDYSTYIQLNDLLTKNDIEKLCASIFDGDILEVLNFINRINNDGKNVVQIFSQIMYFLRDKIVNYYINGDSLSFDVALAEDLVNIINEKMFDIKKSDNPKIYIEILILKFIEDNVKNISREIKKDQNIAYNENENIESPYEGSKDVLISKPIQGETNSITHVNNDIKDTVSREDLNSSNMLVNTSEVLNIDDIMKVRVNNTLATANKQILKQEIGNLDLLNDYTFDQEIGYLVCEILNSKFRVANEDNIVLSYEYDSIVKQNLLNLDKMIEVYNKITNSNKSFAIITDEEWDRYRNEYIQCLRNGDHFTIKDEPEKIFEKKENNDIIKSSAIELFGDIVEVE